MQSACERPAILVEGHARTPPLNRGTDPAYPMPSLLYDAAGGAGVIVTDSPSIGLLCGSCATPGTSPDPRQVRLTAYPATNAIRTGRRWEDRSTAGPFDPGEP